MRAPFVASLLALLLLALPAAVQAQEFTYTTDNGAVSITGYNGSGGAVTIPDTINGLPVTGLDDYAFYQTFLTSVEIPDSVTNIGDSVFGSCSDLTNIIVDASNPAYSSFGGVLFNKSQTTLIQYPEGLDESYTVPATVTNIVDYAFNGSALESVAIPGGVISIGESVFGICVNLIAITVASTNPAYSSLGGVLFNKNRTTLIQYPTALGGSYSIPETVTTVGDDAFSLSLVSAVTIPSSVTSFGASVFSYCESLTAVTVPNSVTNLGSDTFDNCFKLASVLLSTNITTIGDTVFFECYKLNGMQIPPGVTSIGDSTFYDCSNLAGINIPDGVTNIGSAFNGCSSLASVTIPASVVSLGVAAFGFCSSLTNITVAASNPVYASVGGVLFDKGLTTLITCPGNLSGAYTVPAGVNYIADEAFADCSKLTQVTIPASVLALGDDLQPLAGDAAFADCAALLGVYFLGNAPVLGEPDVFDGDSQTIAYYLAGTAGWGSLYGGLTTVMLNLQAPAIGFAGIGLQNHEFGFTLSGATNLIAVVEACTNLAKPVWIPISTNTLTTGSSYFSDPQWTDFHGRFYRVVSP
ncbi:MAG: leucine-rich repeat domain-containing protein [Verrucomicrobiota bacterium]